ncbi:ribonuclease HII [Dethiobacter alkaliphilus]|uniref:Ribonuclease HII n=1 Tax=Dethiobacter alkaliphilus AHT 1 TaxID=555088 RepID=C0GHM4_DETAL|nr:ribonuclease HII [Dethiobacter alkaliphilus]EEG77230.1 Ribonuclease H [Dethiobacter alkaliphilus AHT 1]
MTKTKFSRMTIGEINKYLAEAAPSAEELELLSSDGRAGARSLAQRMLNKLEKERQERKRLLNMLKLERAAREKGFTYIAGVDEAGRGPLAGPVVAGAVILPDNFFLAGLNDSKKLTPQKREELYEAITSEAVAWSVGIGEVWEIDDINILQASKLAMYRALLTLSVKPDYALLDALELEELPFAQQGVVGGDGLSLSIAAASVVAKVTRDRLMCEQEKMYPGYGFSLHKGYPTAEHRSAIAKLGPCPIHRKSFLLLPENS